MIPIEGAVLRVRPKLMTVLTDFIALMPILWATTPAEPADWMHQMSQIFGRNDPRWLNAGAFRKRIIKLLSFRPSPRVDLPGESTPSDGFLDGSANTKVVSGFH